jgi:hypothetical protein
MVNSSQMSTCPGYSTPHANGYAHLEDVQMDLEDAGM